MHHWSQLATRNWRVKPGRTALSVSAVALGVAVVVWVTCCYESVRVKVTEVVLEWIGRSHVIVEPVEGRWAVLGEDVEPQVAGLPMVRATTVTTREFVEAAVDPKTRNGGSDQPVFVRIEATGVRPEKEHIFRTYRMFVGRFLEAGDSDAVVAERILAREWGFDVGDSLLVRDVQHADSPRRFKVVGLVDRRRASANQPPMIWLTLKDVQAIRRLPGTCKSVDVILADRDAETIRAGADAIRGVLDQRKDQRKAAGLPPESLKVTSTETQHQRLGAAQNLLQFIMMLLSCVVLLTAFFIIVATVNMGLMERLREMGLMRCVGLTRRQVCMAVVLEIIPIGLAGVIIGVPLGFLLQWLTIQAVPDYIGEMAVSRWGLVLAIAGGLGTTILSAVAPAMRAMSVSPVEATRPMARPTRVSASGVAALAGLALILAHEVIKRMMSGTPAGGTQFDVLAIVSLVALYGGFSLLTPLVVFVLGRVVVAVAAAVLGLRRELLGDEIDRAPFRAAAISCGLMVGLSLIVGLVVWGESVKEGWQFPKEFPEAILYAYEPVPLKKAQALKDMKGLAEFSAADDFAFSLTKPSRFSIFKSVLDQFSRFIAVDPDTAFGVIKLTYVEGNDRDAQAKLRAGDHVLLTREFAQARDIHAGDKLTIWVQDAENESIEHTFTVAGVIASPGLDIAISFFNATGYYQIYAVGSIVGTLQDAKRLYGREYAKLMFFNFDLPEHVDRTSDDDFTATTSAAAQSPDQPDAAAALAIGEGPVIGDGEEERVVNAMLKDLDFPPKAFVTARQLKTQIDNNIDRVTLLLSAIPFVGLLVAALGVANLMTANVASRSRQIAVLRAIGTTKGQISRIVLGEALILGLLGSGVGLLLGVYLGHTSNAMTELLTGFRPDFHVPIVKVAAGGMAATVLCMAAALLPARYASRSNIVAVLGDL